MACSSSNAKQYVVQFEGNNSKKWDGKEMWIDAEALDEHYKASELVHGNSVIVPWRHKGGKIKHWKAIYIDPAAQPAAKPAEESRETFVIKIYFKSYNR